MTPFLLHGKALGPTRACPSEALVLPSDTRTAPLTESYFGSGQARSGFSVYLSHFTLVGAECSHCCESVTPLAISAQAFVTAARNASFSVAPDATRQLLRPSNCMHTSTR